MVEFLAPILLHYCEGTVFCTPVKLHHYTQTSEKKGDGFLDEYMFQASPT